MAEFITDYARSRSAVALGTQPQAAVSGPDKLLRSLEDNQTATTSESKANAFARLWKMAERMLGKEQKNISLPDDFRAALPRPAGPEFGKKEQKQWDAAAAAAKKAQTSLAELGKMPASAFIHPTEGGNKGSYDKAMKVLKEAVANQMALKKAISDYDGKPASPAEVEARLELMGDCDRRAGQMLSMAAQLRSRQGEDLKQVTAKDAMRALSLEMHGHKEILEAGWDKAETLFQEMDALAAGSEAPDAEFAPKADNLKARFQSLKNELQAALEDAPDTPIAGPPTEAADEPGASIAVSAGALKRDAAAFLPLMHSLDGAMARLDELHRPPAEHVSAYKLLNQLMDIDSLEGVIGTFKKALGENDALVRLLENTSTHLSMIKAQLLTVLHAGRAIPEAALREVCDRLKDLGDALARPLKAARYHSALGPHTMGAMENTLFALGLISERRGQFEGIWMREMRDINAVVEGAQNAPAFYQTEQYIALAARSPISLPSLVECSLRGINPAGMEKRNTTEVLEAKALGAGACNTVTLYTFFQGDNQSGKPVSLVFKPEIDAKLGMTKLFLSRLGYSPMTRVVDLNTASCFVADQIGCGNVLAQSTAGCVDGRFGLFMELAPGHTAYDWMSRADNTSESKIVSQLKQNGKLDAARASLQKELCKLEWADLLSGQLDRHGQNYLLDINPHTGEVKVTGIDNDASFSHGMLGPGKFMLQRAMHAASPPGQRVEAVDAFIPALKKDALERLQNVIGINQSNMPELIDRDIYDRLMAINTANYREQLRVLLRGDEAALGAAMSRLAQARALATELFDKGRVIGGWPAARVDGMSIHDFYVKQDKAQQKKLGGLSVLRLGFYARDCLNLLR
ncbi:MAG: hypothetical protein FWG97_02620 [Deltaproteobacteria bacterium]|nr:hypothetical protein [Deltaproteobacteria bacterium]